MAASRKCRPLIAENSCKSTSTTTFGSFEHESAISPKHNSKEPIMNASLYTGKVHTTGGRDGAARSSDGRLEIKLSSPGRSGSGTNPEQLFAAGWSSCFMGGMGLRPPKWRPVSRLMRPIDVEVDLYDTGGEPPPTSPQRQPAGGGTPIGQTGRGRPVRLYGARFFAVRASSLSSLDHSSAVPRGLRIPRRVPPPKSERVLIPSASRRRCEMNSTRQRWRR